MNEINKTPTYTILGAVQKSYETDVITNLGFSIDFLRTNIESINSSKKNIVPDALAGRGLFMSIETLKKVGRINTCLFRQAHGDLEFTSRAKEKGVHLSICRSAVISTLDKDMGSDSQLSHSIISRLISGYTTNSIRLKITFFSIRGPLCLRLFAFPRYMILKLKKNLFKIN